MRYLALPFLLFAVTPSGQDSPADRIVPRLTDDAIVVGRLDLASLNIDAAVDRLGPFLQAAGADADSLRGPVAETVAALRKAGAAEAFAVLSPSAFPEEGLYFILPGTDRADAKALAEALRLPGMPPRQSGEVAERLDGATFIGGQQTLARLKAEKPGIRPGLAEAFAAVEGAPVQIVLTPSADHRRVLRELLPDLPPDFGGASGADLAAVKWAAVGISFEPKLSAKLILQADSEQAAETVNAAITASLRRLSTEPAVLQAVPVLPLFVGSLTPRREGDRLVLVGDPVIEAAENLLGGVASAARETAGRDTTINHLKQIGLAFHNFADTYGSFPPSAGYSGEKPLLSWRVYLLPYLEQSELYAEFHLDEPWDSEHNKRLIERMPEVYRSPRTPAPAGHTVLLAPVGEGLVFGGKAGLSIRDITDGTSNTVLVLEAAGDESVPWTKPDDLAVAAQSPLAGLTEGRDGFAALLADGSVMNIGSAVDAAVFRTLLTPAGGEPVDWQGIPAP